MPFAVQPTWMNSHWAGGIRDAIMFQDFKLLYGFIAIFAIALAVLLVISLLHLPKTAK